MEEKFILNEKTKESIFKAVSKMTQLVGSTMGPSGGTVIIPDSNELGRYKITKDGVSVAKVVKSTDPYEQVVIDLIKEIASNTVKIAGDGTTTSIVLTYFLLERLQAYANNKEAFELFDNCLEETIEYLESIKKTLKVKDVDKVAKVAANGDEEIASLIHEAYTESKVVYVERSNRDEDYLEVINGLYIPSNKIVNIGHTPAEVTLDEPYVVVIDKTITKFSMIQSLLEKSMREKKPVLIIAHGVHEEVLASVALNNRQDKTNVHFIKSPGFSTQRTKLLSDIAAYCNCEYLEETDNDIKASNITTITKATIKPSNTIIFNEESNVSKLIKSIEKQIKDSDDEHTKDLLTQRLDRLKGLSIIKVGAKSETEMNEKYDRYEDAVLAVACALEDGVVEGGGLALAKHAISKLKELEFDPESKIKDIRILFYLALLGPLEVIIGNGAQLTVESDLLKEHIYDPVKVTKTALEQSYNFVRLLLTTKSIILTDNDYNQFTL